MSAKSILSVIKQERLPLLTKRLADRLPTGDQGLQRTAVINRLPVYGCADEPVKMKHAALLDTRRVWRQPLEIVREQVVNGLDNTEPGLDRLPQRRLGDMACTPLQSCPAHLLVMGRNVAGRKRTPAHACPFSVSASV